MFDRNSILEGAALNPAPGRPATAIERATIDSRVFSQQQWSLSSESALYRHYQDYVDDIHTRTGKRFLNPLLAPRMRGRYGSTAAALEQQLQDDLAELRVDNPDLPVRTQESIRADIGREREAQRAEQRDVHDRTIDWPVSVAGFGATMGTAIADPPVLATMALGAPRAAGILGGALIDAGIGMAVEIPIQAKVQTSRRQFGEKASLSEAAFAVGAAGGGGFLFSALLRGAGRGIRPAARGTRALLDKVRGLPNKRAEVRAAESYLQRMVDAEDVSPLTHTPEGRAEHSRRLSEAETRIREGEVADLGKPRTPVRDVGELRTPLTEVDDPVSNLGQKLREDALERVQFDQRERLAVETVAGLVDSPDDLKALHAALRGTRKKPESLLAFLHRTGGLQDSGGELKNLGITARSRPGLLRKEGRKLDDATLDAFEAGFFAGHSERPAINDLLDAIGEELQGRPRLRIEDEAVAAEQAAIGELNEALIDAGIDVRDLKPSEFAGRIREVARSLPDQPRADAGNFREPLDRVAQETEDAFVEADVRRLYAENPDQKISFTNDDGTATTVTARQMFDDLAILDDDLTAFRVCAHG